MAEPGQDRALRWDEPPKTPADRPPAQPQRAAQPPPARAPIREPYSPHGYVPPSYRPQPPAGGRAGFSSSLQQWQTSRESIPTREQHEAGLHRSLERGPPADGSAPAGTAPVPPARPPRRMEPHAAAEPPARPYKKGQGPVLRSVVAIVITIILLGVLQVHGEMGQFRSFLDRDLSQGLPALRSYPVSSEFKINRVMSSTCRGSEMTYTVYIGIPKTIPGQQEVVDIAPNPAPTTQNADFWTWSGTVTTGQKVSIVIGYHVKATLKQWSLDAAGSGTVAQIPAAYSKYLGDEWKFTPADTTIKGLAAELAGGTDNTFEKVQKIYRYIHDNFAYQTNSPAEPKEPTETLADKAGDCDDQSFLLGSLLRSQGIPAWMEMGLLYDQTRRAWGGHAWLRTFIPDRSGGGQEVQIDAVNDEFLFRDTFRLTDYVDEGNGNHLEDYYVSWRYTYTGAPPLREDRYDPIFFRPSDKTVEIAATGPGPGAQALGQLWKLPGFGSGLVILALAASAIVAAGWRRRDAGG